MLVAIAVAPAMAQVEVYQGDTLDLVIEELPAGSTYDWEVYCDWSVDLAQNPGNCTGGEYWFIDGIDHQDSVQVVFETAGQYLVKIEAWDPVACTNNMEVYAIIVHEALPEVVLQGDSVCIGDPAAITFNFAGEAPWSGELTNGTDTIPFTSDTSTYEMIFPTNAVGTTEYWVTELTDNNGTNDEDSEKTEIEVYPEPDISRIYLKED